MMRVPAILQAERKADQSRSPAFLLFAWESPAFGGKMKAHHGAELSFVFDTIVENADRIGSGNGHRILADQMRDAWSRFAHTGAPNHSGLPLWKPYDATARSTMIFDMPSRVEDDPLREARVTITPLLSTPPGDGLAILRPVEWVHEPGDCDLQPPARPRLAG